MKGLIFDIKEFALHDGEGVRTTVFFKGCPLRCIWCHNPEGLRAVREVYLKHNGCLHCGLCQIPCSHPECRGLGRCLHVCPQNLVSASGTEWECDALAERLLRHRDFFSRMGGGITLSGGEPLLQADFCEALLQRLHGQVHCTIETSGYADASDFVRVTDLCDFVIMDLKLADSDRHLELTGVRNERILANAAYLQRTGKPHLFRVPLIPALTDTPENLRAIAAIAGESAVELLPYNKLAPAKYAGVGLQFTDRIDPNAANSVDPLIFRNATMRK
jgi:pyruvate formate lyase activating enzyme